MARKEFEEQVIKRLDAMIALMLEPKIRDSSIKEKVKILYNIGLDYNQIAGILSKKPGNIAVIINSIKKKK